MVPLFTGGELSGRIDQARSAAEAAGSQASWAADNAALAAGEAWVMLAQAEEFVSLLTKARDTVKAHVELAKSYVEQGMLVRSELLRAEVELARVEDLLEDAKGKARVANANLAFRIGVAQDSTWQLAPLPEPEAPRRRRRRLGRLGRLPQGPRRRAEPPQGGRARGEGEEGRLAARRWASRPAGTSTTRTSSGRAARPGRSWPSPR